MSQFTTNRPLNTRTLGVILGTVSAILLSLPLSTFAQVGPSNPSEMAKPKQQGSQDMEKIKNTFSKWFGSSTKDDQATAEDNVVRIRKGAGAPGQFDMITRHRKPSDPKPNLDESHFNKTASSTKTSNTSHSSSFSATGGSRLVPSKKKAMRQPSRPPLLSQAPLGTPQVDEPTMSDNDPPLTMLTLENEENPYGISAAQTRINKTAELIEQGTMTAAKEELIPLKSWLIDATEAHIGLYKALNKIPSAQVQAELEKQVALEFAHMRDTSMYQMARVHLSEGNPSEAIDLLVEVVKSQPGSTIGLKSYELLQTMGFTQKLQLIEK